MALTVCGGSPWKVPATPKHSGDLEPGHGHELCKKGDGSFRQCSAEVLPSPGRGEHRAGHWKHGLQGTLGKGHSHPSTGLGSWGSLFWGPEGSSRI